MHPSHNAEVTALRKNIDLANKDVAAATKALESAQIRVADIKQKFRDGAISESVFKKQIDKANDEVDAAKMILQIKVGIQSEADAGIEDLAEKITRDSILALKNEHARVYGKYRQAVIAAAEAQKELLAVIGALYAETRVRDLSHTFRPKAMIEDVAQALKAVGGIFMAKDGIANPQYWLDKHQGLPPDLEEIGAKRARFLNDEFFNSVG